MIQGQGLTLTLRWQHLGLLTLLKLPPLRAVRYRPLLAELRRTTHRFIEAIQQIREVLDALARPPQA